MHNNNLSDLESLKNNIKPYLRSYLENNNVAISANGMFRCVHKMHDDSSASCRLMPDSGDQQYYCFGCGATGDIFEACAQLESKPNTGLEFVTENVYHLADKFGVPYTPLELTAEQLEKLKLYRFHKIVADLLVATDGDGKYVNWTAEHTQKRGWAPDICRDLRVSTVSDYNKFLDDIQTSTGLTKSEIIEYDIKPTIFGSDVITITLFDDQGRPVGFSGRWLDYTKGSKRPKYNNTSHSPIFTKGRTLYGIHLAKRRRYNRCDIFEGYGSVLTALSNGHASCVAVCGTAFTPDQVDLLKHTNITNINLVFDPDAAGEDAARKHMLSLSGHEGLDVTVTYIPEDGDVTDPEDYIKKEGLTAFLKLESKSAFDFMLEHDYVNVTNGSLSKNDFMAKIIKMIVNTSNRIERGQQIKKLSELTDTPEVDIRDELDRLSALSTSQLKRELQRNLHGASSVDDILSVMDTYGTTIKNSVMSKDSRNQLSTEECVSSFDDLMLVLNNKKVGIQGWKTGYTIFDNRLSGMPKPIGFDDSGQSIAIPGSIFGIAGAPQNGKSTVLQNLALRLAKNNDDIRILYWSLDDSRERTIERMLAMHSKIPWRKVTRRDKLQQSDEESLKQAQESFRNLLVGDKLVIKDHSTGSNIPLLKRWLEMSQQNHSAPHLVIIDGFHKIGAASSESHMSDYSMTKSHSQEIKQLAQTHKVTIIASLELNKSQNIGSEPNLHHITETRKIEYDFDIIATVFNQYYENDGNTAYKLEGPKGQTKPLIKFNIKKSKDGGAGIMWFALDQTTFDCECLSPEEVNVMLDLEEVKSTDSAGIRLAPSNEGSLTPKEQKW